MTANLPRKKPVLDVVIVGAGAAGIGMALTLEKIGTLRYAVIESGSIAQSFRQWPANTFHHTFISQQPI